MVNHYPRIIIIFLIVLFFSDSLNAQKKNTTWSRIEKESISKVEKINRKSEPKKAVYYQLDINKLKSQLVSAPLRGESRKISNTIIEFPNADGSVESFRIKEAPVMVPKMQANYPEIRSYIGQSLKNPSTLIRFSLTPMGLHTITLSSNKGVQYIDPYSKDGRNYIIYSKSDLTPLKEPFICSVEENDSENKSTTEYKKNANDGNLRTFRLALACTAEYGNFHGGTEVSIKSAMAVTMTRVNGIYERDLSITMTMVENADIIYFGDVDLDPYTNDDGNMMLDENQTEIDSKIGSVNYDIGHVFSTGGGGIASLNSPCIPGSKSRGVTGSSQPIGDAFDIDYVAHEMGHQFGAPHTFNSNQSNCGGGNRTANNAYEPGSGSTIMAYAGICSPDNVQLLSDSYFHQKSLQMIWANITTGNSQCATLSPTGNAAPTAQAGNNYTIPNLTPYKLTGSSTDTDGINTHTYTWEQYDLGTAGVPTEGTKTGPILRSFEGTSNKTRYIPRLVDLRNSNGSTSWEKLSSVIGGRIINFQLTVRDNDLDGGQTATDNMMVTTTSNAGPFIVTSQNNGDSWTQNTTETITWNVAGTTGNGINVSNVNILLSTDGGLTYPTILASNTPNDGSQNITVPNILETSCRVMVEAVGNIFFNINTQPFAIGYEATNTCMQYNSGNLGIAIPDGPAPNEQGTIVGNIITIPTIGIVTSVKVNVDVTHQYVQDLVIQLTHPSGESSTLWARDCDNENGIDIIFDDNATAVICQTGNQNVITGTFSPIESLNVMNGLELNRKWLLSMADFYNGDIGTFNDWYLDICANVFIPLNKEDFGLTNFSVYPNPNNGEFTIKLKSHSNNEIHVSVYDMRGRNIYSNNYKNTETISQTINLNHVQAGMYLIKVIDGDRSSSKKIIIK